MGSDLVGSVTKEWAITNQATAGAASASKAAVSGVRHVCAAISVSVSAGATAQTPVVVNLRDGATGAGTILASWALSVNVNETADVDLYCLNIAGTSGNAMTLEFASATAAGVIGSVNLIGYDN